MKMPPAAGGMTPPDPSSGPLSGEDGAWRVTSVLRRTLRWLGTVGRRAAQGLCDRCPACGALLPPGAGSAVCPACAAKLAPRRGGYCPRCGEMTDDPDGPVTCCPTCRGLGRPWDGLAFHARYDGLLRELILDFKFGGRLGRGRLLGDLLLATCRRMDFPTDRPDMLLPVPLHPRRLAWRGFNQSLELAKVVGRGLDLAVRTDGIARIRYTTPQSRLPGPQRLENLHGAFWADPAVVKGRAVVLVDDVMTTGATVATAAKALRRAGTARVDVLVIAR